MRSHQGKGEGFRLNGHAATKAGRAPGKRRLSVEFVRILSGMNTVAIAHVTDATERAQLHTQALKRCCKLAVIHALGQ